MVRNSNFGSGPDPDRWRLALTKAADLSSTLAIYSVAALLFAIIAFFAIDFTRGDGRIAMVWVPNAIVVAALLRWRLRSEMLFLAFIWGGNCAANLAAGDRLETAAALAVCNFAEITIAIHLIRRFIGERPDMRQIDDLLRFTFLAGLCAPALAATFAVFALGIDGPALFPAWITWLMTDGLGMILIAPVLLILTDALRQPRWPTRRELLEWPLIFSAGTFVTVSVFAQTEFPLLFLVPLVVLVHSFRLGSLGTALSILKIGIIATVLTWMERGPIHINDHSLDQQLVVLQAFLATAFVIGLPVAAILNRQQDMIDDLEDREGRLNLLADNMSDAVMRFDMEGKCTFASASVKDVLGRPAEELLGHAPSDNFHPEAANTIPEIQRKLLAGESEKERFTYRRLYDDHEGMPAYIEADCVLVRDPETEQPQTIIVSCRNVSDRIRLEKNLVRARRHAENAAAAKSEFLANMSHEIRTPMNGVLGFVELLLQSNLPKKQQRFAELIQDSGNSMMSLLNDILDISKIEAGQIKIKPEPVDIRHCIGSCISLYSANAVQANVKLHCKIAPNVPQHFTTDGLRLRQIVLNLLGNAVKFASEGEIMVGVKLEHDDMVLTVTDNGIGIEPDRLEAIFRAFEQADSSISRKYGGTGLGLPISRNLAEMLGGTLSASSTLGLGSEFKLRIPMTISPDEIAEQPQAERTESDAKLIDGSRILLAEDHDINQLLVMAMLERCNQDVELAEDGQQAVAAVMTAKAQGRPFDLVLMDIQMPECDGYTAAKTIRELGISAEELPIVALTANAFSDDREAAFESGMQGHLAKPLKFAQLEETLLQWLPTSSKGQASPEQPVPSDVDQTNGVAQTIGVANTGGKVPTIEQRWAIRKGEALEAVAQAIRQGMEGGIPLEDLARTVHKLAGTAGMFGEEELGKRAGLLERGLKDNLPKEERLRLASELMKAA